MTWGKALVEWAASPEQALTWLTDLNHRLALDGNDPASYGGLLWCLGEFDRPFKPAKPVWGEVRDRSTQVHAQRCPPEALSTWVEGRNGYHGARVGIVGAGVTGIAAALLLRSHGVQVTLWDKGYNLGGESRVDLPRARVASSTERRAFILRARAFSMTDSWSTVAPGVSRHISKSSTIHRMGFTVWVICRAGFEN